MLNDIENHVHIKDWSKIKKVNPKTEIENNDNVNDDNMTPNTKNHRYLAKSSNYQRGRREWTEEETECLKKGIQKYQSHLHQKGPLGIWAQILNDNDFKDILRHRTNVMLKDKFRTLQQKGLLDNILN